MEGQLSLEQDIGGERGRSGNVHRYQGPQTAAGRIAHHWKTGLLQRVSSITVVCFPSKLGVYKEEKKIYLTHTLGD